MKSTVVSKNVPARIMQKKENCQSIKMILKIPDIN